MSWERGVRCVSLGREPVAIHRHSWNAPASSSSPHIGFTVCLPYGTVRQGTLLTQVPCCFSSSVSPKLEAWSVATASEAEVCLLVPQPRPHPSVPVFLSNPSTGRHHDFLFFFLERREYLLQDHRNAVSLRQLELSTAPVTEL